MTTIYLTLTDSTGRIGTQDLGSENPMVWTGDEDDGGETVSALFEQMEDDGTLSDSVEIDGDDWRCIDSEADVSDVLMYVRAGVGLEAAVEAVELGCDPCGYDADYEKALALRDDQIATLLAAAKGLLADPYLASDINSERMAATRAAVALVEATS